MEMVYFILVSIALYFISGWILDRIESYLDRQLAQRSVAFLFILMALAIPVFAAINQYAPK